MSFGGRTWRIAVMSAFLAALSIVLGKYLAINVGEVLRFSFENLPILFAGMAFGPIAGIACGVLADLVGCVLVGYPINPIITVGAAVIGAIGGIYRFLPYREGGRDLLFSSVTVFAAHLIGSCVIKTVGLSAFYDMPIEVLFVWRLLNYAIIGLLEGALLYKLLNNKNIRHEINRLRGRTKE